MMTQLILNISNESDLEGLLPLLCRLNIVFFEKKSPKATVQTLETAFQVIDAGSDFSALGDPVEWQRAQRQDRELPFF
jgi:hypothetical protein